MSELPTNPAPDQGAHPPEIVRAIAGLEALRRRARSLLIASALALILAAGLAAATILGLADYFLRLPSWIRGLNLAAALGLAVWAVRTLVRPAWRFRPSLTSVALRIERRHPELTGALASAVDFAQRGDASHSRTEAGLSDRLAQLVVRRGAALWKSIDARDILDRRPTTRRAGLLTAALLFTLAFFIASPALWSIGAARIIAPWSSASWPKRTGVVDLTRAEVYPLGVALPLQAAVTRSNRPWESTFVAVRHRLVIAGRAGEPRRELLTFQDRRVDVPAQADVLGSAPASAALFERLIEPLADAVEYRFETDDDQTEWRTIRLVEPPAVVSARATIEPPAYARELLAAPQHEGAPAGATVSVDLGPGTDERASAPASLSGSAIDLTINLNRAVDVPADIRAALEAADPQSAIRADGQTWTIRWTLDKSLRLPVKLRDSDGIESVDESVFRFEATTDRAAAATITDPPADRAVLATATIPVTAEGRDDVGLAWAALERAVFKPAGAPGGEKSGPGGAMQPASEPVIDPRVEAPGQTIARASATIELASLELRPGDELRLTALAMDLLASRTDGRAPTRSAVRTLRIISEADLLKEIQGQLAEIRQGAIRIDEQQADLQERTEAGRVDASVRRGQAQIGERLARHDESVRRLVDRVKENGLADRALDDLLSRSRSTINDAGQASQRAAEALDHTATASDSPRNGENSEGGEARATDRPTPPAPTGEGGVGVKSSGPQPSSSGSQSPQQPADSKPSGTAPGAQATGRTKPQSDPKPQPSGSEPGAQATGGSKPQSSDQQQKEKQQPTADQQQAAERAAEAQEEVREHIRSLVEMLDRGEDAWLMRSGVERLLKEQNQLKDQTAQLGQKTAGRSSEQLAPEERSELDRIVDRQNQLADETKKLVEDMRQRESKLAEKDPAGAQGLAQAARRAEQQQVAQKMQQAAQAAKQNQTSRAGQQQQAAADALQEMMEDMNASDQARDEILRRTLASIIQTLQSLIAEQQAQLAALDAAQKAGNGLAGLDAGMIRLNQNTLGVMELVRAAGADAAPVGSLVTKAGDAQSLAIIEIRRPIMGEAAVRDHENRSLDYLKRALAKASEVDKQAEQRQQKKKLAELKKAYRALLELQVAIRAETEPIAAIPEPSRRDRLTLRTLGERQEGVRQGLADVRTKTKELADAKVFIHAHERLDAITLRASQSLTGGTPRPALASVKQAESTLRTLLESLNDPKKEKPKFSEGAGGGGGGGGGGSGGGGNKLIPPVKELVLLRQLQTQIAEATAEYARNPGAASPAEIEALAKEQRSLMSVGEELVNRILEQGPAAPDDTKIPAPPMEPDVPPTDRPGHDPTPD